MTKQSISDAESNKQLKAHGEFNRAKLDKIKSSVIIRRQVENRELIQAVRGESAAAAIGKISPGCEIFGFTKGQFSCIDMVLHLLRQTGPADMSVMTWSISGADIRALDQLLKNKNLKSIRFLVDYSFRSRKPEFCRDLVESFGYDALRITVIHAKTIVIRAGTWDLVIRTSMNFNYNPRFENFEISDDKTFADFQMSIFDEIWKSQDAAEGFGVRPYDNKQDFKKAFEKEESIFGEDIPDARDLI